MKVFLTGGTGFIGQLLTQTLLGRGWEVVCLVRKPDSPQAHALLKLGAQCVPGDVTARESMRAGMRGADIVVHNAAWYEVGVTKAARPRMRSINVTGTENVLSLAQELAVPRTVYVSSTVYYGDTTPEVRDESFRRQKPPVFFYEQTKAEAHELALGYIERGLPLILICPAHVVGPNDHSPYGYFQRLYVNRVMPPFAWGPNAQHSPAHVEDVAEGIALAAERGRLGETYVLAGQATSMRQLFDIWASQPGGFRVRLFAPFWLMKFVSMLLEPVQRWLGMPAFLSREAVSSTEGSLAFSSAKAQRELGWTYRPARELWADIFAEEQRLLACRTKRDLVTRLKPIVLDGQ